MSKVNKNQERNWQEISRRLKAARHKKGYSLNDVHEITRIQLRYLNDIDDGKFKDLPGNFYIRAFIEKYANSVGLDGREFLKQYNHDLPDIHNPDYMNEVSRDQLLANVNRQRSDNRKSVIREHLPLFYVIALVAVILIVVWLVFMGGQRSSSTRLNNNSTSFSGSSETTSRVTDKKSRRRVKHQKSPRINIKKVSSRNNRVVYRIATGRKRSRITVKGLGNVQALLKTNNRTLFQTNLKSGKSRTVLLPKNVKNVTLNTGNASKLHLIINGKKIPLNRYKQAHLFNFRF